MRTSIEAVHAVEDSGGEFGLANAFGVCPLGEGRDRGEDLLLGATWL